MHLGFLDLLPSWTPVSCRRVATAFVPDDFEVPLGMATDLFRLEPLGPER